MSDRRDMESMKSKQESAVALGKLLAEHNGIDVKVLDVSGSNSWADFFIIATVTSAVHSRGLQRHVHESLKALSLEIRPTRKKASDGEDWVLIDLGDVIVHLMSPAARAFYDLEKLWFGATDLLGQA